MCCGVDWVCIQVETLEFDYQSDISNTKTCSCCDTVSLPGRAATSLLSNLGSRGRIDWLLVLGPDEQPQQKLAPAGPVEYCSKQRELETSLFLFFMQRRWRASRSSGADLPSSDHSDHLLGSLPVYTCKAGGKQNSRCSSLVQLKSLTVLFFQGPRHFLKPACLWAKLTSELNFWCLPSASTYTLVNLLATAALLTFYAGFCRHFSSVQWSTTILTTSKQMFTYVFHVHAMSCNDITETFVGIDSLLAP